MILKVINHDFIYDMKNLCTVFFPWEKINDDGKDNIEVETKAQGNEFFVCARLFDKSISKTHILKENEDAQTEMSVLLYNVLSELTGFKPPWGILFGVRPAKLMHRFTDEMGEKAARDYFINTFLATPQKPIWQLKLCTTKIKSFPCHLTILSRFMFQFRFAQRDVLTALLFPILLKKRISFLSLMLTFFARNLKKQVRWQRLLA